jgi:REP element-mobilizing transposase RayT
MSTAYQIKEQEGLYFLTFQVVDWTDIFTRQCYRDIVLDSLKYCQREKGLIVWAYVVMSNHVHIILSSKMGHLSDTIRDFKRFTATRFLKAIDGPNESRSDWFLKRFEFAARRHKRNSQYQFWTHENHAIELASDDFIVQKCHYIHENPVRAGWVSDPRHWRYSSASNYAGEKGLMEVELLDAMYKV